MAYFNSAFSKRFLGTGETREVSPLTIGGFIVESGIPTGAVNTTAAALSNLPAGYFGFFDKNFNSLVAEDITTCCPLYLASSSLLTNDKIGSFHGGYKETNKSKLINPKYVQKVYAVEACEPKQAVVSVGTTPQITAGGLDVNNFQGGTTEANCSFEFLCGETYNLRIDVKGSPALRALNHNAYQTMSFYTGCCAGTVPDAVDSTLVMIGWAEAILANNYLKPFVLPVVFDEAGLAWFAPGTVNDPITGAPITPGQTWDLYVSAGHTPGATGGLRLFGAYVGTVFGDCTFQITDFFEKEPVKIYASLVDYNGDPCAFEGLCAYNDCQGLQGMGFGDQVLKDFILSESYLQNFFHTDLRIREITQGYDISTAIPRNALYQRYYILHSVPRFNNPSGTFDNDRYMLEIVTPQGGIQELNDFLEAWLTACIGCEEFATNACTACVPEPNA